jgi:phage host-nuclease inhibitor protein Gam
MKRKHFNYEETAMTDERKAYEEKFDAQLKEWGAEIALLKAKAEAKITDID